MTQKYKVSTSQPPSSLSLIALSIIGINSLMISSAVNAEVVELEKIVVTGEKIDKSIKDTTTAVTVFTEEKLESGEVNEAKSLATKAPNVVENTFGHISMRGISGGGAATGGLALMSGSRARIATVVDGATQDWSGYNFAPTNLWDTKQVEILRGPQSTTQGSSAIGGAIVINTNDPTFEQEAAIRLGLENYDNGNFKHNMAIMSSGALVEDELAYRIAADQTKGSGWLNYDTSGYSGDLPDLDDSKNQNLRGKLLWKPSKTPELSAKLTIIQLRNEGEHANFVDNSSEGVGDLLTVSDTEGAVSRVQDSKEDAISTDIDYEIKPGITNSFHIGQIDSDIYADGYGYANSATTTHTYDIEQKTKSLENRIIFNQENSKITGVVGLFASDKDAVIDATQGTTVIDTEYTTKTTAIYGEGTYSLSDKTKLTTGIRIENEDTDKTGSFSVFSEDELNTDKTYTLPKLAISHDITSSTTIGASVRKGYSPSGSFIETNFTTFTSEVGYYNSEEVTAYELSSKSDFGQGTNLNINLFYNDYTDYQAASGFSIVNVDKATTYGLEVEATTWANDNLELWGSIGLLKTEIDEYKTTSSNEGNKLSGAPETNTAIGFTQYFGDEWSFAADITYVGSYYSNLANTDTSKVGNYTITNAQAQYALGELTLNAYVKNLTNEDAVYYREGSIAAIGQSRTVGVSAVYRM
ncbi:TonB-dependent receptor [Marinomonas sp. SBI22]|uniref:TonB-dependent receptor n=1 Tax=unclassified Marinomonas TaxID=196814 RepID=UPI0007AFC8FB|nr:MULTISPECIES: TonB-dependent receptor [unclassified Marinomonas]KZM45034.1 TonB-dependent receptor [Marinomonas sp. SBI22]KZM46733.1 TonB-dependent receptor [Marinomonas sp. SBI8L]